MPNYQKTKRACYMGFITQAIAANFAPLLFLKFHTDYHISLGNIALISTCFFFTQLLVDLFCARFVDKIGYRVCIVTSEISSALGLVGLAFLPELLPDPFMGIIISVIVYAVGSGLIEVLCSPIMEACPFKNKEATMSLLHSFYCWGSVGTIAVSTLFFAVFGMDSWKWLAVLWAIVPAVNVYNFATCPIEHLVDEGEGMKIRELFRKPVFWIAVCLMVCSGASELSMSQWASAYAEAALGLSKTIGDLAGPCMLVAAAEGDGDMINGRGDAYCGMLNCSYNLGMRHLKGYIPEYPVGMAEEIADKIAEFVPIARTILGVRDLKIITFGPRPQDFFACNAPIKGLYELGVEIEENSELDLLVSYKEHAGDPRIADVCADMAAEMGEGHYYPDLLTRMAQFELTLLDWAENHKGSKKYVAFADKCWPAFPSQFGFEPCYVNSRLASRGIPVACEVDIYGALSEYIGMCASGDTVTLLDINNSVPKYIYDEDITGKFNYKLTDTFMGFHCGNTPSCKMCSDRAVKYQLIQHRLLEPAGSDPDFTRGTLEGDIAPSDITFYRLQCDSEGQLRAYIAQGEILPVATRSFGGIAIFAIPEMGRFYRHVLIQKRYPHHGAVAFGHYGKTLFEVFKFLGIADIAYNQPTSLPYPTENPFA